MATGRTVTDITGKRFGPLEVLRRLPNAGTAVVWLCRCHLCGKERPLRSGNLKTSKSCGCRKGYQIGNTSRTKHGASQSPTYKIWVGIKTRCFSKRHHSYSYYGGRGITLCDHWKTFENFLADMGERPPGMSIDRIDNDGNYEPGNCRWTTMKTQMENRREHKIRRNRGADHPNFKLTTEIKDGVKSLRASGLSASAAGRRFGISPSSASRICRGEI